MTFNSVDIIQEMLKNDGTYPGDPQAALIYEYTNRMTPQRCFAVFMDDRHDDMHSAPNVENPVVLWVRNGGITAAGKAVLSEREN